MNNNSEFMPVECLNVPKVLFYDKQYEDLSMDAKLIYALLLDRKEMAIRNEWVDEYGDTYVIYPKQEMKKYLNISRYRIDQALAELEEHDQMVEVTVPYPGKLCQFYVKDITDNEKQMEEDIMKKMKESNEENFCRASGCGYARCFTGISPKYMAKMNKEDRNNFQTAIEEILEDLNLGGHVTAEPLMPERTKEYFDSYKDEAYYSLSPKKAEVSTKRLLRLFFFPGIFMRTQSGTMLCLSAETEAVRRDTPMCEERQTHSDRTLPGLTSPIRSDMRATATSSLSLKLR